MAAKRQMKIFEGTQYERVVPFFEETLISMCKLASGTTAFQFFQEKETDSNLDRNYSKTAGNPLKTGQGKIVSIRFDFLDASYAVPNFIPTITGGTLTNTKADKYTALRNLSDVIVKVGTDEIHRDSMRNMLSPMPWILGPVVNGAPAANTYAVASPYQYDDGGQDARGFRQYGFRLNPNHMIYTGVPLEVNWAFRSGASADASLANMYLVCEVKTRTIDGVTIQAVQ